MSRDWKQRRRPFAFRWFLPGVELALSFALVYGWAVAYFLLLRPASEVRAYRAGAPKFPSHSAGFGSPGVGASRHAAGILAVLTWPVAGTAFWWIVGRAWEALPAARKRSSSPVLTWIEVSVGAVGPCVRWIRHRTGRDFRSRRNHLSLEVDGSGVLALGWAWVVGAGCSDCAVAVAEADAARRSSWQGVDGITTLRR